MLVAILVISIINLFIVVLLNHIDELEEKRQFDADFTLNCCIGA